jgi:hypothetical protein
MYVKSIDLESPLITVALDPIRDQTIASHVR